MGDKIVVMNHGVVEQFGRPQDIYDWPATRFVANFIGSPPMNFLPFHGMLGMGGTEVTLAGAPQVVPAMREGASGDLVFGVRPEHVHLSDSAAFKGRAVAVEYLGTTQIVTFDTACGTLKARLSSAERVVEGTQTGLRFDPRSVTIFDAQSGHALLSEANERVLRHG